MRLVSIQIDSIGILASTVCMIHCLATPFLFIAKACSATCCSEAPIWWQVIDYLFLLVSFMAIYLLSNSIEKRWLLIAFWVSWFMLFFTILNHSFEIFAIPSNISFIPAISIVLLHFYNLQFCKCKKTDCCK